MRAQEHIIFFTLGNFQRQLRAQVQLNGEIFIFLIRFSGTVTM